VTSFGIRILDPYSWDRIQGSCLLASLPSVYGTNVAQILHILSQILMNRFLLNLVLKIKLKISSFRPNTTSNLEGDGI
jgi:hypothetical protein